MRAFRWTIACAIFSISSVSIGAPPNGIILSHHEPLQLLNIQSSSSNQFEQKLQAAGPLNLSFDALGQSFDIQLEPNTRLLSAESRAALPDGVTPYRGQLVDKPGSWTRIVIADGLPRGVIWDGEQLFAIEAPGDSLVSSTSPIIYRLADAIIAPGTMSCGTADIVQNGTAMYNALVTELGMAMAHVAGAVSEISIGAVGDFEFTSAQGGDANAATAIVTRLNIVDGIYSQQLDVQINVPPPDTFSTSGDPFTDVTDPSLLLNELAAYRQITPAQNSQGLTHMFTGRNLDGSTVGIAFSGALCSTNFGAGLSQGNGGAAFDSLVAAHEIGHNFGAPHDSVPGSACELEPSTFLMATSLNGSSQFSACSITEMQDDIAAAACITPLPSTDISIALNGLPPTVLLGNSASVTFDVTNNGTEPAINVVTNITLPGNVSFLSSGASMGICTDGAGVVNCILGDVSGGSGATVTVSTISSAVGTGTFNATVVANADDNITNNVASALATVNPAVGLVVRPPASSQINVNQSTTVAITLDNLSILDATGVTLSVTLASGLQADSVSWSIGTCSITGQQINCQTGTFAAQSSSTLSIGVTGLTSGAKLYTMTLSSNEVDADPTDNSASGTVNVNTPRSGGGSIALVFLCLLGCAAISRRSHQ